MICISSSRQSKSARMIRTTATTASIIALACSATFAFASEVSRVPTPAQASSNTLMSQVRVSNTLSNNLGVHGLKPRKVPKKVDPVTSLHVGFRDGSLKADAEQMDLPLTIVVKFRDDLRVRAGGSWLDGASVDPISGGLLASTSGGDIEQANAMLSQLGGRVRQWINQPADVLAGLEARAIAASGTMQPDLAGMIEVRVNSASQLFSTARALNSLDCVEFASIDRKYANFQCGENGQNCAIPVCNAPSQCNPEFGTEFTNYGCSNAVCCAAVAALDPVCGEDVENGWDRLCAGLANAICGSEEGANSIFNVAPGPFDSCFSSAADPSVIDPTYEVYHWVIQSNDCFLAHGNLGCKIPACCFEVCTFDPTCCQDAWDENCVVLASSGAFNSCAAPIPTSEPSPDFTPREMPFPTQAGQPNGGLQGMQFYIQSQARAATVDPVYISPGVEKRWEGVIDRTGFYGEELGMSGNGFALQEFQDFQNFVWNTYQGGAGSENPNLRGGGLRIAVLESSGYVNHEEFLLSGPAKNPLRPWDGPLLDEPRVVIESDQTPLLIEDGNISAAHGTNTMGVIFAAENGFGITGMATGANGYFYPTISMEEGARAQNAIASCILNFQIGDVMNFSWGFSSGLPYSAGNFQPITSNVAYAMLLEVGTGVGITSVVAAGGDALGGVGILGTDIDSGAIIVGAILPGNIVRQTIAGEISGEVVPGQYNPPGGAGCEGNLFDVTLQTMRYEFSNVTGGPLEDETVDSCGWGQYVVTTGSTTAQLGTIIVSNPTRAIFTGLNEVPPSGATPELQVDKLRTYTTEFGGTSSAAAMISGVVSNIQAAARQFFGTPLAPSQVRNIMRNLLVNFAQCPGSAASGEIGVFPNLVQLGPTIIGTPLVDGNLTTIIVRTGLQLPGYGWSSFLIKAPDFNYLRMGVERREAGTVTAGLTNMATGPTTDVQANITVDIVDTSAEIISLGITTVSRATKNFVMMGVFVKNIQTHRFEFFGLRFLTIADVEYNVDLPNLTNYSAYVDQNDKKLEMRVWTCGLGAVGRHQVWHDLIELRVNDPMKPL